MEISDIITRGKITMVIKDDGSSCIFSNGVDIGRLICEKNDKPDVVVIDDINDIKFYELRVVDVINKFIIKYNVRGKKFLNQILKLSTLSVDYLEKDPFLLKDSSKFKLVLALALSLNPKMLVINNLSCYVDNKSREEIMFTLKKLRREYNKTIVVIDNDVDYFYSVSDDVLVLWKDTIVLAGKKELLYDNYTMLKRKKIPIPVYTEFVKKARDGREIDLLVRDDVKDIMKDIYRSL